MNDLIKQETTLPAHLQDLGGFEFGADKVMSSDIVRPKIFLEQGNSPLVNEGKTRPGDIVESAEKKVLGNEKEPTIIIPFFMTNHWAFYWPKEGENNGKLHHYEDRVEGDELSKLYAEKKLKDGYKAEDGTILTVYRALNLHCFVKSEGLILPYSVMLKKSSFGSAATPFIQKIGRLSYEKKPFIAFNWVLGVGLGENEKKQKWKVFTLDLAKDSKGTPVYSTAEEYAAANSARNYLIEQFKLGKKVDLSDAPFETDESSATTTQSGGKVQF